MIEAIIENPRIVIAGKEAVFLPYVPRSKSLSIDADNTYSGAVHLMPLQQDGEQIVGGWHRYNLELVFSPVTFLLRQQDTVCLYRPFAKNDDIRLYPVQHEEGLVIPLTASSRLYVDDAWKTVYAPEEHEETPFYLLYKRHDGLIAKAMFAEEDGLKIRANPAERVFTDLGHLLKQYAQFARPLVDEKPLARSVMTALQIKKELDARIIGQEEAKIAAATVGASYLRGYSRPLFLVGSTGVGKTELAKCLAAILEKPFESCNLQEITTAGYVGGAIEAKVLKLAREQKTDRPVGIILFDELDKKVDPSDFVGGQGVQDALLPIIEGQSITPDLFQELRMVGKEEAAQLPRSIDTSGLLCICAGAFNRARGRPSLDEIAHDRVQRNRGGRTGGSMGFGATITPSAHESGFTPQDLVEYGIKPELVGRFKNLVRLHALDHEQKLRILDTKKGNVLEEYQKELRDLGYGCTVEREAKNSIVDAAHAELGARGLGEASQRLFRHVLFDPQKYAIDRHITITGALADELLTRSLGTLTP